MKFSKKLIGKTITKAAIALSISVSTLSAHANDQVQFLLDWLPSGEFAAYYAGVANGFWREQGIDLQVSRGYGAGDTVNKIATGAAQFGVSDMSNLLAARVKTGAPVKAISSMYVYSPHALFVLESSGINSFSDLAGKRIGISPGNSHQYYFPTVAQLAGFDPQGIEWVTVDGATMSSLLISKNFEAAPFFAIHEYYINKAAEAQGEKIKVLSFADAGFLIYSAAIIANDRLIEQNPDLGRRFLAGLWKSVEWAREHPQEACQLHVEQNPEVALDDCIGSLTAAQRYVFDDFASQTGFGKFDEQRLHTTWEELAKAQDLDPAWDYHQAIDTSYLPANP